jgi:hypothetical protein
MRTGTLIDLVESDTQQDAKYLSLKSLRRMTRTTTDYPTLIGLKQAVKPTQALQSASTVLRSKLAQLKLHKEQQHAFLVSVQQVKQHSRLSREGGRLFAELGRGKYRGNRELEFAPDSLEILRDSTSTSGIKLVVPKLLSETPSLAIQVSSKLFEEWPDFTEVASNEVLEALHKAQDLTMMKMMLADIKRCEEYTVHCLASDEFTLGVNVNQPDLALVVKVGLKSYEQESALAKVRSSQSLLIKVFHNHLAGGFPGQPGLLMKFIECLAHLEVKAQVYQVLTRELDSLGVDFVLKKEHVSPVEVRFSVLAKQKLLDVEVNCTTVRACAYCSPYLSEVKTDRTFIAIRPMVSVHVRDLSDFLRTAVRAQR